jgi:CHAT domain-containing protein
VEGERIARLLGATPLFADAAVESAIKHVRSPLVLHIATHGFFLPDRPVERAAAEPEGRLGGAIENPMLRSGLALAGANTWLDGGLLPSAAEDALLNGEDVSALDLTSTELVVLSACDTGLGDVTAGEGVFGLRRAFVLAGARTLIMSLWKVPDQQTQELMTEFYDRILAGAPRAAALRAAQLAIKAVHPDPLYWGAFICQGDPGPVRPSAAR